MSKNGSALWNCGKARADFGQLIFLSALMALMVGPFDWKVSISGAYPWEIATSQPKRFKLNALASELLRSYWKEHNATPPPQNGKQMAPTRIGQSSPQSVSPTKKGSSSRIQLWGPDLPADRPTKDSSGHLPCAALLCPSMPFLHRTLATESHDRLGIIGLRNCRASMTARNWFNRFLLSHWC